MTTEQRAAQIWSVLVFAAQVQRILSYSMLGKLTGLPARAQASPLGRIAAYCERKGYPPLNALVIRVQQGWPGDGLPSWGGRAEDREKLLAIYVQQSRVFAFDWSGKPTPAVVDFRKR